MFQTPDPDKVIHQPVRLKICAALSSLEAAEFLEFQNLKKILGVTDGNLGSHIATLEKAGYIKVQKDFNGRKPRTRIQFSPKGRKAFGEHLLFLKSIVDSDL